MRSESGIFPRIYRGFKCIADYLDYLCQGIEDKPIPIAGMLDDSVRRMQLGSSAKQTWRRDILLPDDVACFCSKLPRFVLVCKLWKVARTRKKLNVRNYEDKIFICFVFYYISLSLQDYIPYSEHTFTTLSKVRCLGFN